MLFTYIAFIMLLAGILASILPGIPGPIFSGLGIFIYWWSQGYSNPNNIFLIISFFLLILSLFIDWFGGAITARIGGASNKTSLRAGIAGLLGFLFAGGPLGVLIVLGGTVFAREYLAHGDLVKAKKAALYSTAGFFISAFMQLSIAVVLFIAFAAVIL